MQRLLILLNIFCCISLNAQTKISEKNIGWKDYDIQLHSIADKNKQNFCSFLLNEDSIHVLVQDSQMEIYKEFSITRKESEDLIGGFVRNNKIYLFLDNGNDPGLHNWTFDIGSGNIMENVFPFKEKKELLLGMLSCGDHFMIVTFLKKTLEFVIHDYLSENQHSTLRYKASDTAWKDLASDYTISNEISVNAISGEGEPNLNAAGSPNKLYAINDTLYLISNNNREITRVYTFDLANQKVTTRDIFHAKDPQYLMATIVDNSFLLNNKLYYVRASDEKLQVQVVDFYSGRLIKQYMASKEEGITFSNSDIVQEGAEMAYGSNVTRHIGSASQLLRKMVNAHAVIMATEVSSHVVELSIGSYKAIPGPGMPVIVPINGGFATIMLGSFHRNDWSKSARFKMLVDETTGEHIERGLQMSINEKIESFTKDMKISPSSENLLMSNGQYYYLYYVRKQGRLTTIRFTPAD